MINSGLKIKYRVFLTAGGNPTGIIQFPDNSKRLEYPKIARYFMSRDSRLEQFGFLEGQNNFYMSGGEFSGNGAAAAAWLIYKTTKNPLGGFSMSGLKKPVSYKIFDNKRVQCEFFDSQLKSRKVVIDNEIKGVLIEMDGIRHFVLDSKFKFINNQNYYKTLYKKIIQKLNLDQKSAVGVIWQRRTGREIKIDPIVRVKDIDSFFYETACGSGSLAVLIANGRKNLSVIQPSGKNILASKTNNHYSLTSEIIEI
jgi:diaminopimelate epimerase